MVPVELRVIHEELDALAIALVGELFERVFAVRRGVNDVVLVLFGGEHGEAIVMARGHDDVAHARLPGERNPLRGIVFHWIELRCELLVLRTGDVAGLHHPLAVAQLAVDAPVDEHAEAGLLEPLAGLQVLG